MMEACVLRRRDVRVTQDVRLRELGALDGKGKKTNKGSGNLLHQIKEEGLPTWATWEEQPPTPNPKMEVLWDEVCGFMSSIQEADDCV